MFCGEIATLIPVDVELGLDETRDEMGGQKGAVKKGSQGRLPRDDDDDDGRRFAVRVGWFLFAPLRNIQSVA